MTFSGQDAASKAWRREQAELSSDIAGLPRDRYADAMIAALDALDLTDGDRIVGMTAYFMSLALAQSAQAQEELNADHSKTIRSE